MIRTLLVHSSTGVAALIWGLRLVHDEARMLAALPALWPAVSKPGQSVTLESESRALKIICFNSGPTSKVAHRLMLAAVRLWDVEHLQPIYVQDGLFCWVRIQFYLRFPSQRWLLNTELSGRRVVLWK